MKTCNQCHQSKLLSEFNHNKSKKDGLHDSCRVCRHTWYIDHKESEQTKRKQNYVEHRSEYIQRATSYQQEHKEERQLYLKQYHQTHYTPSDRVLRLPEEIRAYGRRRASVRRKANLNYTQKMWEDVKDLFNHCCAYCLRPTKKLTVDHIVPVSKGGLTTEDNIVPACQRCNNKKLNRSLLQIAGINFVEAS